jgi:hypothetical protein
MQADFSVELGRDDPALEVPWSSDDPSVRYYDLKVAPELLVQLPEAIIYPPLRAFLARINAPGFPLATVKCDAWSSRELAPEEEIFGDRKFVSYVDLVFQNEAARCSLEKHEKYARELCRLLAHAPDIAACVEIVIRRCYFHRDSNVRSISPERASRPLGREMTNDVAVSGHTSGHEATSGDTATTNAASAYAKSRDVVSEKSASKKLSRDKLAGEKLMPGDVVLGTSFSGFYFTVYVTGFGDEENEPCRRWEIALALMQHALVQSSRP